MYHSIKGLHQTQRETDSYKKPFTVYHSGRATEAEILALLNNSLKSQAK